MIDIFGKTYKAVSNIFVSTIEGDDFTYPSPISICATIEDESKNTKNQIEFRVSSFLDSFVSLDTPHSIFCYLLSLEYKIDTFYVRYAQKEEVRQDLHGYKATYLFVTPDIAMNMGLDEIFDKYQKIKNKIVELEIVNDD